VAWAHPLGRAPPQRTRSSPKHSHWSGHGPRWYHLPHCACDLVLGSYDRICEKKGSEGERASSASTYADHPGPLSTVQDYPPNVIPDKVFLDRNTIVLGRSRRVVWSCAWREEKTRRRSGVRVACLAKWVEPVERNGPALPQQSFNCFPRIDNSERFLNHSSMCTRFFGAPQIPGLVGIPEPHSFPLSLSLSPVEL
jgi:hypothetical protein